MKQELRRKMLRQLYELTPREAHLASLLASGLTVQEASDHLCCAPTTARLHLERIFKKTRTHRQAELVQLILSSPAIYQVNNTGVNHKT
jgi:DNA-binding CsgD family transcriptional regulator